jgi:NAD(P)-dependent dehydrogenase (short-subunit alcohol dehydrogenase family)
VQLTGKAVLVTGGASGLGGATARLFAAAGAKVTIADLNVEAGSALARELNSDFIATNVTDPHSVSAALSQIIERHRRLDIAVNCAGIATAQRTLGRGGAMNLDAFRRVIEINLVGTFNVARLAAEKMAANTPGENGDRGVIVLTASIAAYEGQIGQVAYAASKGGVVGMTLPLARDLARHAIRVVSIAPGMFRTPLLAGLPQEAIAALEAQVPFPARLGNPEDYAMLVRQIVENPYLNGEVIRLDGALRMTPK